MNIGSFDGMNPAQMAAELAAGMSERICGAHEVAGQQLESGNAQTVEASARDESMTDSVGYELRAQLEEIVSDVISDDARAPDDLLGAVVDVVVADRIERTELDVGSDYQREVAGQMRSDPTVVAELDDILQSIARDLALRR